MDPSRRPPRNGTARPRGRAPFLLGLVGLLVVPLGLLSGAAAGQEPDAADAGTFDAPTLGTGAGAAEVAVGPDGTARVIVGLDVDATPEHELDPAGAFAQRIEIAVAQDDLDDGLAGTGAETVREIEGLPYVAVEATPEALAALEESPAVASVEPDLLLYASLDSTTPIMGADAAQGMGYDGSGQTIAILDNGVDRTHPFFSGRVVKEACFSHSACPNGGSTQTGTGAARPCSFGDGCWHGTHVAGIAAGDDPNGDLYTGVAPGADVFAVQVFSPVGGYVLDRWGTLHTLGVADPMSGWNSGGFPNWDIARSFVLRDAGGGYILDAWGGLHRAGSAPVMGGGPYWQGWDIARGLALRSDGNSGYVMDGWGGLHRVGGAPVIGGAPYWSGWDIARDVALHPDGGGYTLDGWGGIHEWGGAPKLSGGPYWPGWDIARGLELTADGTGAWVVDAYGGRHGVGTAPSLGGGSYWPPWSIARDVAAVPSATAYTIDVVAGLNHVYQQRNSPGLDPIAAVNMSLGGGLYFGTCDSSTGVEGAMTTALSNLRAVGIAPVAASGNQGSTSSMNFPACISHAISVGATKDDDSIASFTNLGSVFGAPVDLLAPGKGVVSAVPGFWSSASPPRGSSDGTSMATPHVAGAFAVVRDKAPAATVNAMLTSFKNNGAVIQTFYRRLQLDASLDDF